MYYEFYIAQVTANTLHAHSMYTFGTSEIIMSPSHVLSHYLFLFIVTRV